MSEQPNLSPEANKLPEKPKALDAEWYKRYEDIASLQAYEYFDDPIEDRRTEARKKFEADFEQEKHSNPHLEYPKMDAAQLKTDLAQLEEKLSQTKDAKGAKTLEETIQNYKEKFIPSAERLPTREAELRQLKRDILKSERNDVVKQAYRWRINEKIAELRLMEASQNGDMRAFQRFTKFVYGDASPEVFSFTVDEARAQAEKSLTSENEGIKAAAQRLLEVLPTASSSADTKPQLPDPSLVERVKQEGQKILSNLSKKELPAADEFDAQTIFDLFSDALQNLNAKGWSVIIDTSSKTGISVDQEHKTVRIPQARKLAADEVKGKILHEIGTHVARRVKGERSKLMLLGLGLDRYEQGEEGVTTMFEKSLSKKGVQDFAGLEFHLAIGLAQGLDGKKRDFHDVYEILLRHHQLKNLKESKKNPEAEAKKSAWNQAVRVFRGTDCTTPGAAFTKDIIYRQGNIAVWEVIGRQPDELLRINIGKYDPSNDRHAWILTQLGITDDDLEQTAKAQA